MKHPSSYSYLLKAANNVKRDDDGAKINDSMQCCADNNQKNGCAVTLNYQNMIRLVPYRFNQNISRQIKTNLVFQEEKKTNYGNFG